VKLLRAVRKKGATRIAGKTFEIETERGVKVKRAERVPTTTLDLGTGCTNYLFIYHIV
jgi:hypothetical protein